MNDEPILDADNVVTGGFDTPPADAPMDPSQPVKERTVKQWEKLAAKNEIHLSPLRLIDPDTREILIHIAEDFVEQLKKLRVR